MKMIRIMRFNDSADTPALLQGTAPVPTPRSGELLVRVHAAGVTPTELLWYPTTHALDGSARTGAIPGHEFSGVVEGAGADVDPFWIGREVFGMNDWFADGASAEYCLTVPASVAEKPSRLTHAEAASVPIGALTAWQGLFDRAKLQAGERILIHGGSGAVGVFAIQFARRTGAHIITTASERNFAFLTKLGANECIDYRTGRFEETVRDLDIVFDTVGGETLKRSWNLLKPGGRMATIAADSEGTKDERIEKAFFIVEPNQKQLTEIAALLETGELRYFVDAVVPFAQASDAYRGKIEGRKGRGKTVLSLTN
ncbi:MAG TPA: NADP-dependent oxidoreductase [Chthoniobacterales bacterium]